MALAVRTVRLILCGFGRVGRAFGRLLLEKAPAVADRYGLALKVAAIAEIDGSAVAPPGEEVPLARALEAFEGGQRLGTLPGVGRAGWKGLDVIGAVEADVLVETTPTNFRDGEPALSHVRAALARGLHVASANKGPFLRHHAELRKAAEDRGLRLLLSAAAAAALPTIDVGLTCLAGATVTGFEGILNGTTNYILTRMQADGVDYAEALGEAQALGIAEPDPRLDVEGQDTANKVVIIANAVLDASLTPEALTIRGIAGLPRAEVDAAGRAGRVLKLIGRATRTADGLRAGVEPVALPPDHPLAHVHGAEKAITYFTDTMDRVTVSGGKSDPRGAAAALLKDIIHGAR